MLDAFVSVMLSLALASGAPPDGGTSPAEAVPTETDAATQPDAGPPIADPTATEATPPPVSQETPEPPPREKASPEPEPAPPPPTAAPPPPPMQYVDGDAVERARSGQRVMNISGIVMASGGFLLLVGLVSTLAVGRAPDPAAYDDIEEYRNDSRQYGKRAFAGSIISAIGGLGVMAGAIAFTVGGIRYLRGKKRSRATARITPAGAVRF